jgi:hypothetical protein
VVDSVVRRSTDFDVVEKLQPPSVISRLVDYEDSDSELQREQGPIRALVSDAK